MEKSINTYRLKKEFKACEHDIVKESELKKSLSDLFHVKNMAMRKESNEI